MFERFTEKSRRVIFFARYEASVLGSPSIESEHLLLGLLREDRTLAASFLGTATLDSIRRQIEAHAPARERISTSVDLPLSHQCQRILVNGLEEVDRLGHKRVGTRHLLMGILREEGSFASELLREKGVQLDEVRREATQGAQRAPQARRRIAPVAFGRFAEPAMRAVCFSVQEAMELGSSTIDIEHLLLGTLHEDQLRATIALRDEASVDAIRGRIAERVFTAGTLVLSRDCEAALGVACLESERLASQKVETAHLLLGILYEEGSLAATILEERGVTRSRILDELTAS